MKHLQSTAAFLIVGAMLGAGGAEATRYLPTPLSPTSIEPPAFSAVELLTAPAADAAVVSPFRLDLAGSLLLLAANRSAEEAEGEGVARGDRFGLELASRPWMWPLEGVQGGKHTSGCFSSGIGANYRHQKGAIRKVHLGCYKAPDSTEDMDTFRYGYGGADQLTYIRRESIGENVEFVPGPNGRIASRDGVAFWYDQVGRRTLDDRHAYKWDWRGRLYEVRVLETGHRIEYEYDALGRLMWRKHWDESDGLIERRDFVWESNGLVSEIGYSDDAGTLMRWRKTYLLGPGRLDNQYQVHIETFPSDPAIEPIDKVYTYLRDEMGTVIALIEEAPGADPETPQEPALRYQYSPCGEIIQVDGSEADGVRPADLYGIAKPFPGGQNLLFQGLWADPVTGLSYARARWYDARASSWLSEDPKGDVDSPNLYVFVGLSPYNLVDPFGSGSVPPGTRAESVKPADLPCSERPLAPWSDCIAVNGKSMSPSEAAPYLAEELPQPGPLDGVTEVQLNQLVYGHGQNLEALPDRGMVGDVALATADASEEIARPLANLLIAISWPLGEAATGIRPSDQPFIPELVLPENDFQEDLALVEQTYAEVIILAYSLPGRGMKPPLIKGSGPQQGVLEVSERSKSVSALRNYNPRPNPNYGGNKVTEFVYDPTTKRFAVGRTAPGSWFSSSTVGGSCQC